MARLGQNPSKLPIIPSLALALAAVGLVSGSPSFADGMCRRKNKTTYFAVTGNPAQVFPVSFECVKPWNENVWFKKCFPPQLPDGMPVQKSFFDPTATERFTDASLPQGQAYLFTCRLFWEPSFEVLDYGYNMCQKQEDERTTVVQVSGKTKLKQSVKIKFDCSSGAISKCTQLKETSSEGVSVEAGSAKMFKVSSKNYLRLVCNKWEESRITEVTAPTTEVCKSADNTVDTHVASNPKQTFAVKVDCDKKNQITKCYPPQLPQGIDSGKTTEDFASSRFEDPSLPQGKAYLFQCYKADLPTYDILDYGYEMCNKPENERKAKVKVTGNTWLKKRVTVKFDCSDGVISKCTPEGGDPVDEENSGEFKSKLVFGNLRIDCNKWDEPRIVPAKTTS